MASSSMVHQTEIMEVVVLLYYAVAENPFQANGGLAH